MKIFRPGGFLIWSSESGWYGQVPHAFDEFVIEATEVFLGDPELLAYGSVVGQGGQDVVKGAAPLYDSIFGNLVGIAVAEESLKVNCSFA